MKYKEGDRVEIVFPCPSRGKIGTVTKNVWASYIEVKFSEKPNDWTCFSFESSLKLISEPITLDELKNNYEI